MIEFERGSAKAKASLKKHCVSFEEAQPVFYGEFAVQFFDDEHAEGEERFLLSGMRTGAQLLLVCHCERGAGNVIRIISARQASKRESAFYGSGRP